MPLPMYGNQPYNQPNYNLYQPPYNPYGNYNAPPYQNQNMQMQPNNGGYNQNISNPKFLPLTYTNGVEGAKAFNVNPNNIVYILDSDNPILYQKTADNQGRYYLTAYKLEPIEIENIGKKQEVNPNMNGKGVEYATKSDIQALQDTFKQEMNKLLNDIETLYKKPKNQPQQNIVQDKGGMKQ